MSITNKDNEVFQNTHSFDLVSLFAGAGGLDIGLENAGFTTKVINELEFHACETLRQNKRLSKLSDEDAESWVQEQLAQRCYLRLTDSEKVLIESNLRKLIRAHHYLSHAEIIEGDIRSVSTALLLEKAKSKPGQLTLVAGGPPCQPFSRAGKRETVETDDGKLFLEFVRIVDEAKPRWFLFENVKGLTQSRTLVPYFICSSCRTKGLIPFASRNRALQGELTDFECPSCGLHDCEVEVEDVRGGSLEIILNEFEAIGYRCYHKVLNAADYGVPQSRERLFIVGSRDAEEFEWPNKTNYEPKRISKGSLAQQQLNLLDSSEQELKPWLTMKDVLWKDGHPTFGQLDLANAQIWVKNVVRPHDEPVCWSLDRPSPTVGAHQAAKLALAPDGVPPEQLERQQWHTKGKRQSDLPPVDVKHAYLSDAELLQLQTFPNGWYLYGTRMQRAFQIGNAVPPKLAEAVGKAILKKCISN